MSIYYPSLQLGFIFGRLRGFSGVKCISHVQFGKLPLVATWEKCSWSCFEVFVFELSNIEEIELALNFKL